MRQIAAMFLIVFLMGCSTSRLANSETYLVTEDVFLLRVDDGLHGSRLALVPESGAGRGSGYYSAQQTMEQYRSGKGEQTKNIVGIVTRGTKIKFILTKTKKRWSFWYGKVVADTVAFGEIISGPFAGKVVDINDVVDWPKKRITPVAVTL